ncbi:hypothetical protein Y1Q_0013392 [Alligator mississippiensis]|uniref:Uncharacterized protein n=1 Tax=Alligator mississippiensis TaxID=8496 RepID=A0A151NVE0_ALLMI|nr:hypothetical protein Y1Q_0013392 [Alligator mississippiensis]
MPFMQKLGYILDLWDPGQNHAMFSSTGGLLEPPPWPGNSNKSSMGEGPSGHQEQVLVCFLPLALISSSGRSVVAMQALGAQPHPRGQSGDGTIFCDKLQLLHEGGHCLSSYALRHYTPGCLQELHIIATCGDKLGPLGTPAVSIW